MSFPLGRPVFVMIVCGLLAGGAVWCRRPPAKADLTMWTFADLHARMYREGAPSLIGDFQNRTGKTVRLDLIAAPALDVRLLSLFMFAQPGSGAKNVDSALPDLVELPLTSIGKYLRPPVSEIGFLPLNDFLQQSGWRREIVESRFVPWSKDGQIFGVPHDLHPSTLTYRKDLFDQAGVDLESAQTWDELQQRCLIFQQYWRDHGRPRAALALSSTASDMLIALIMQQHASLVESDLSLHLTDEKVVNTLCWYAKAVAGDQKISVDLDPAPGQAATDLSAGDACGLITPDWLVADLKRYGPGLTGKLHMMPLPKFSPDDSRTASMGGTMIGITRACRNPQLAWKLIESLYLNPASIGTRQQAGGIIPPIAKYWLDPVFHQPDPFYAGQKIDEMYINLAKELPPVRITPYTAAAQTFLTIALNQAVTKLRTTGSVELGAYCRATLVSAQQQVASMIQFDSGN